MAAAALPTSFPQRRAFTLIELLVVMSIIALLISILMPSLGRARAQAKSIHCLARLKEFGTGLATYENTSAGVLPPPRWFPEAKDLDSTEQTGVHRMDERPIEYGWSEVLFAHVYGIPARVPTSYAVQRNVEGERWQRYFICEAVGDDGINSGHYRVYLPAWSMGTYVLQAGGVWGENTHANPYRGAFRDSIPLTLPLMGDANDRSERGDGLGYDDCSYIDAGDANYVGSDGISNGNRFSDRHYGGANYLFQDLHGAWKPKLREELARDYDLNGIPDIDVRP